MVPVLDRRVRVISNNRFHLHTDARLAITVQTFERLRMMYIDSAPEIQPRKLDDTYYECTDRLRTFVGERTDVRLRFAG
jgi:hypothetical protein